MSDPRCLVNVSDRSGWYWHQCDRPAKVERDGKHYCGVHDPERRAAKERAEDAERKSAEAATDAVMAAFCERYGIPRGLFYINTTAYRGTPAFSEASVSIKSIKELLEGGAS